MEPKINLHSDCVKNSIQFQEECRMRSDNYTNSLDAQKADRLFLKKNALGCLIIGVAGTATIGGLFALANIIGK